MGFPAQSLRGLTDAEVQPYDGVDGVYGMTDARAVVLYVGMGDIGAGLRRYANGANPEITRAAPTHFLASIVKGESREQCHAREVALIREFNPACSRQHVR